MPMAWQTVSLPLLGGVDTKSDPRALAPPKLAVVENAVFDRAGSLRKRFGSALLQALTSAGAYITNGLGLMTRGDELLVADGERLWSYAEGRQRWYDKGPLVPLSITTAVVANQASNQVAGDYDEAAGVGVYAWEDSRGGVRCSVVDTATGEYLVNDQVVHANGACPRVVAIDGFIHILFSDATAVALKTLVVKPEALSTSLAAAALVVTSDIRTAANVNYDVVVYGSYAVLAWTVNAGTSVKVGRLAKSGALTMVSTSAKSPTSLAMAVSSSDQRPQVIVVAGTAAGVSTITVDPASMTFTAAWENVVLANVVRVAIANTMTAVSLSGDPLDAAEPVFSIFVERSGATADLNLVEIRAWSDVSGFDGVVYHTLRHSVIVSGGFRANRYGCVVLAFSNSIQPTYFVHRHDAIVIGRMLGGSAGGVPQSVKGPTILPNPKGSEAAWTWIGVSRKRLDTTPTVNPDGMVTGLNIIRADYALERIDFDFSTTPQDVQVGETLYITAGQLMAYDGQQVVESGFALSPEGLAAVTAAGGAMTPATTVAYRATPEWTNARGERERGPSLPFVVTLGAADTKVTITIPTVSHTRRTNLAIVLTRTQASPKLNAPFYRVSSTDPTTVGANNGYVANSLTADTVTFVDVMSDVALLQQELDYRNTGEFEHLAPSPASIIAQGQNRVFLAGGDDPNTVQYSLLRNPGAAVPFGTPGLTVDRAGGPITALALMNEQLVVFKRSHIYIIQGDGPSNVATGDYAAPQLIVTDCGCVDQRSVVTIPEGIAFQTAKGIYLLDQSLRVTYIGADVEAYNGQTITAATLLADSNQVRFLTDAGVTLVYDYLFHQWAVWTGYTGTDAVLWKGSSYCRLSAAGRVYQEAPDVYDDAGAEIRLVIETAWIKAPNVLQGVQRIRRWSLLGEYKSPHQLRISVGRNYEPGWDYTVRWDPATALNTETYGDGAYGDGPYGGSGSTVYQPRGRLRDQKCESIRFRFEDVPATPPGESFLLTELALEVGVARGLHKRRSVAKTANSGG